MKILLEYYRNAEKITLRRRDDIVFPSSGCGGDLRSPQKAADKAAQLLTSTRRQDKSDAVKVNCLKLFKRENKKNK